MICKHCGHDHEAWPAEAARCDQRRVATLTAEVESLEKEIEDHGCNDGCDDTLYGIT